MAGSAEEHSNNGAPAPSSNGAFTLGGQAVIEGVMMRGPHSVATAVRRADGEIVVDSKRALSLVKRRPWLNRPLLRGVVALFESLSLGLQSLNFSANQAMLDVESEEGDEDASSGRRWLIPLAVALVAALAGKLYLRHVGQEGVRHALSGAPVSVWWTLGAVAVVLAVGYALSSGSSQQGELTSLAMTGTMIISFLFGIGLFVVLPNLVADRIHALSHSPTALNLVEGALRLLVFVGYILAIGLLPDIRRVFQYHGAEHKVVWAAEKNEVVTIDVARPYPTAHPRCGTSFVFLVLVLSIIAFGFLGWPAWYYRIASRILLLPVIAGIGYELIRLSARCQDSAWVRVMISPGLLLQRLTTRPPDDNQIEVAIRAMERVQELEASTAPASGG